MKLMGIIFANDATMGDLTEKRTMASLPFGGRYRLVDFHLSNMCAAGIRNVGIISRHNYQSLMNHIGDGEEWGLELGEGGLEFLTPYAMSVNDRYRGKLENLHFAMDFLTFGGVEDEYVVVADSAVLCNIDLLQVVSSHIESGKDITVVTKKGIANGKKQLDLALKLDDKGQIADMAVNYVAPEGYLASMDLFVFKKEWLIRQIEECVARDRYHMDRDLIMGLWRKDMATVNVFEFEGVAMYNESVEEYFRNSLDLLDKEIRHDLFGGNHPIFTKVRDRVPSYYGESCEIENCLVADGCFLEGEAEDSILFRQVTIGQGAEVEDCVIMNDAVIGEGCNLKYVILDKNVTVTPGTALIGSKGKPIVIKRGETV
jgi:glucose-1-phosphate adenylyltransferase